MDFVMKTKPVKKNYGFCYDKRTILKPDNRGNIDTRPYGWIGETQGQSCRGNRGRGRE